jgi:hypothetical protein
MVNIANPNQYEATSAATSFFDLIAVGRSSKEFVDGRIRANNPM